MSAAAGATIADVSVTDPIAFSAAPPSGFDFRGFRSPVDSAHDALFRLR